MKKLLSVLLSFSIVLSLFVCFVAVSGETPTLDGKIRTALNKIQRGRFHYGIEGIKPHEGAVFSIVCCPKNGGESAFNVEKYVSCC